MFRMDLWAVGRGALSINTQQSPSFVRMPCRVSNLTTQGTKLAAEGAFFAFFWTLPLLWVPLRFSPCFSPPLA